VAPVTKMVKSLSGTRGGQCRVANVVGRGCWPTLQRRRCSCLRPRDKAVPEQLLQLSVPPVVCVQENAMPTKVKTLVDLFEDTLKDIYYAEKKILTALPKMAKAAQSTALRKAFEKHLAETEGQVERLEKVFDILETPPRGKKCPAIDGLVDEGKEIMKSFKGSAALDAGLLSAAQSVEHYEIARYGTLKTWAEELELPQAVKLLDQTLQEEKKTDVTLTQIAEARLNRRAEAAE
jgi:ferritin-like metal-binding protein YciE